MAQEYWHILVPSNFKGKASHCMMCTLRTNTRLNQHFPVLMRETNEAYHQLFRVLKKVGSASYAEFIAK